MIWERFLGKGAALVGFAILLLGLSVGRMALAAEPVSAAKNAAGYVGEKVCATCHDVQNNVFGHTLHAKVFRENPRNQLEKQVCEACHGPGSIHAENPTDKSAIIGFSREWGTPAEKQTSTCLSCHKGGNRLYWSGSTHDTNKLSCSDCHNPMAKFSPGGLLKKASITETCQSCHKQQQSEFRRRSHMPVPEGKMSCVDCHNPHGSVTKPLLKAKSVNDICYTCHAEKRGPFLWEHAPAKESCLTCHAAHGSNQDKLLNVARPFLCQQCHQSGHQFNFINNQDTVPGLTIGAGQNSNRALGRSCQNCHSQIHGSNHPSGARFQR